ncbi:MAG: M28 family peptidase [Chloroflexota bacterium]
MHHNQPVLPHNLFRVLLLLALATGLWVSGCAQPAATPTPTPSQASPTSLPLPTATLTTAASPLDVPTPAPSATPTVAPTPTATTESSPLPTPAILDDLSFDGGLAYEFVLAQCDLGPRPTGSEAGWATGDYLIGQLERMGWQVVVHEFTFLDVPGRNIIGKKGSGPVAMLGAHYDTRPYADHNPEGQREQWILGANDGGSGVAVLLELARILEVEKTGHEIWLAFFDAEDRGNLDGWPFSVGAGWLAQDIAQHTRPELSPAPEFVIVVDMVGDAGQELHYEGFSEPALNARIWSLAHDLGYGAIFVPDVKHRLIDDHRPFIDVGIPAIDIIDFDYPFWHTTEDTADKVEPASLERVGRVLELFLETGATWRE